MRFAPVVLASGTSLGADMQSKGEDLNQIIMFSVQAVFTGTPVGTLKLQISDDIVNQAPQGSDPAANVQNWSDYSGSEVAVSAAGNWTWIVSDASYRWMRVVYVRTSGTGSVTITYSGKGA